MTFPKTFRRRSLPTPAPTLDATNDTATAAAPIRSAIRIIRPPLSHRYCLCILSISIPAALSASAAYRIAIARMVWEPV